MVNITNNELARYIVEQLSGGTDSKLVARQLASLLIDERRTRDSSSLLRAIEAELNSRGQTQMTITSAHSVSDEIKKQLSIILDAKTPVITEVIEKDVIGGVKARAGEKEIDLTVRAKLNRFKQQVTKQGN
jgi:F0F1-type ATP synthase delta subunit